MFITSYSLYEDRLEIVKSNGDTFTIYLTGNSGKIYFRYKINTISKIKHPGIFLGVDAFGEAYFLHNHYNIGKAAIVTESEFTQKNPLYLYEEKCSNAPLKVIEIGMNQLCEGKPYHFIAYNCQTFANTACKNDEKSQDVEKWAWGSLAALGLILFLK